MAATKHTSIRISIPIYKLLMDHQQETGLLVSWMVERGLEMYFEKIGKLPPKESKSKDSND